MQNIINRIIEIEHEAQKLAVEAEATKEERLKQIEKEKNDLKETLMDRANKSITAFEEFQKSEYSEQVKKVTDEKSSKLDSLDKYYNENHIKWENELFNDIMQ